MTDSAYNAYRYTSKLEKQQHILLCKAKVGRQYSVFGQQEGRKTPKHYTSIFSPGHFGPDPNARADNMEGIRVTQDLFIEREIKGERVFSEFCLPKEEDIQVGWM